VCVRVSMCACVRHSDDSLFLLPLSPFFSLLSISSRVVDASDEEGVMGDGGGEKGMQKRLYPLHLPLSLSVDVTAPSTQQGWQASSPTPLSYNSVLRMASRVQRQSQRKERQ
jgi:hypothetical protein